MQEKAVLCIDIGTSSLKAALISEEGKVLAKCREQFFLCYTYSAASEWKNSFLKAASSILNEYPDAQQKIIAICISGNGPTIVNDFGKTLLWSHSVPQKSPSLFIHRLIHYKDNFTDDWEKSSHIFSGPEYLIWLLTGTAVTILPEQRFEAAYWNDETLTEWGLKNYSSKLPPFVKPGELCGYHDLFGKKLPVFAGAPDFVSALVGTRTIFPGALCDRAGSSEGLNLCTQNRVTGENIRTLPSCISGLWNASYLIPDSGSAFKAYKDKIERLNAKTYSYDDFVKLIMQDKSQKNEGLELMEQTACQVKDGIATLKRSYESQEQKPFPSYFTITGGQALNNLWTQMKSNITGMEIHVPECNDAELLGDAVFAFTGLKFFSTFQEGSQNLFRIQKIFYPEN